MSVIYDFTFTVDQINDEFQTCTSGLPHSYNIHVIPEGLGEDDPYFIRVTMDEVSDPTQADYEQIVPYPGFSPFPIYNVPSGTVRFDAINLCNNGPISSTTDNNCCVSFPCGLEVENSINVNGISGDEYRFRYLSVTVVDADECFESGESNVIISRPGFGSKEFAWNIQERCWTGNIDVIVEGDGEPFVMTNLVVTPHPTNNNGSRVNITNGSDNNWKPPHAGAYTIRIVYTGNGQSEGIDCEDEVNFDYYGPDHYLSILMLRSTHSFYSHVPGEHAEPYTQTGFCQGCPVPENGVQDPSGVSTNAYYLFGLQGELCVGGSTPLEYFRFIPNSYGAGDPCDAGGWMVYQGMDSNGNPLEKVVYIPPNTSLHHIPSPIPIWYIENVPEGYYLSCDIAGWCFFEAMDVLGVLSPDGQPVAAMYADLGTCTNILKTVIYNAITFT